MIQQYCCPSTIQRDNIDLIVAVSEKYTCDLVFPVKIIIPCHHNCGQEKDKRRNGIANFSHSNFDPATSSSFPSTTSSLFFSTMTPGMLLFINSILLTELSITSEYLNILLSACADRGLSFYFEAACSGPKNPLCRGPGIRGRMSDPPADRNGPKR